MNNGIEAGLLAWIIALIGLILFNGFSPVFDVCLFVSLLLPVFYFIGKLCFRHVLKEHQHGGRP